MLLHGANKLKGALGRESGIDGDSRSIFHTRVVYRTTVFRRRLISDCGRASEMFRPNRGLENYLDCLPDPRPNRPGLMFVTT